MRYLLLLALASCGPVRIIRPESYVQMTGAGFLIKPESDFQEALQSAERYQKLCDKHCGAMIYITYTSSTPLSEVREFAREVSQAVYYGEPIKLMFVLNDRPHGVPMYAEVIIGEVQVRPYPYP